MGENNCSWFERFAKWAAAQSGRPPVFVGAVALIVGWALSGPLFGFGDTWQLVINTSTTIITFLMVFLIQNSQYRDGEAVQIKLDELIRIQKQARNELMDIENLSEEELDELRKKIVQQGKAISQDEKEDEE